MRRLALAALLVLAAPLAAEAQSSRYRYAYDPAPYMNVKLGFFAPTTDDLDDGAFDTGPSVSVAFGSHFARNLAAEFAVGWFGSESDTFVDPGLGTFNFEVSVVPITGALKLVFPSGPVQPYFEAGVGLYLSRLSADFVGAPTESDTAASLGLHLGAGVGFQLAPRTSLLVDLRYVGTRPEFDGIEMDVGGVTLSGGLAFRF
jgi:opacity protein-like surface antigen